MFIYYPQHLPGMKSIVPYVGLEPKQTNKQTQQTNKQKHNVMMLHVVDTVNKMIQGMRPLDLSSFLNTKAPQIFHCKLLELEI